MPSLRTFVSHFPHPHAELLSRLLEHHGIALAPDDLRGTPTAVVSKIEDCLEALPAHAHTKLDHDVVRVDALANEAGDVVIQDITVPEEVADLPSRHARSLWLFLNDCNRFRQAEEAFYNDQKRLGREWTAFAGEKDRDLQRDPEALEAFKAALRIHFDTPNVHLDIFDRTRLGFPEDEDDDGVARLVQITIFREGWPNDEYEFDGPDLKTRTRRPVLEASVTYEKATGTLECVAKQKDSRAELVRLVATSLLGASPDFKPLSAPVYNLDVLRERTEFPTDPTDGVEGVRVAMMRLTPIETNAETVVVESTPAAEHDIWEMVEQRLGGTALQSLYQIRQARIVVRYAKAGSKARLLTFTITQPHRSNLKELLEIERKVASKYLPLWGLVAS